MKYTQKTSPIAYIVSAGKGLESFVYREIEYLIEERKLNIHIFTTKYRSGDIFEPKSDWKTYRLRFSSYVLRFIYEVFLSLFRFPSLWITATKTRDWLDLLVAIYYLPFMKKDGIVQIHCHFGDRKLYVGYFASQMLGVPLSLTVHSHELHCNTNPKMFDIAIHLPQKIFTISELAKNILIDRHGVDQKKIIVNHLFVDTNIFTPRSRFRVLTVARFEPQKGLRYLVDAAELLKGKQVEFIIVGWGPDDIQDIVKDRGLSDSFTFFPKLDQKQLRLLYQSVDAYCLPSIDHPTQGKEGIPVVLIEAMACGLPVIATKPGAVAEIVESILVEEKDGLQIANALSFLINHPMEAIKQGEKNREIIMSKFTKKNIAQFANAMPLSHQISKR